MATVLLVGAGNMGFAMLKGWAKDGGLRLMVVDPTEALRDRAAAVGAEVYADVAEVPRETDMIVLAVKPQVMDKVAPPYAEFPGAVMSVAAGVGVARLRGLVGERPIVRVMPNTPAAIGQGMSVGYAEGADDTLRALVERLTGVVGETAWIEDEGLMDAVTAISGSGPAYVFHFIECLASAGEKLGLAPELALQLARQTVAGAGALAREAGEAPGVLREQVTSPGGTTAAALAVLRETGALERLVNEAAEAARDRGRELG
ncbi:pyrroline-5-carboxylate reductase [Algicella marina]|nr:pyrroline-5-carboxylate reductase [Algicella marina]